MSLSPTVDLPLVPRPTQRTIDVVFTRYHTASGVKWSFAVAQADWNRTTLCEYDRVRLIATVSGKPVLQFSNSAGAQYKGRGNSPTRHFMVFGPRAYGACTAPPLSAERSQRWTFRATIQATNLLFDEWFPPQSKIISGLQDAIAHAKGDESAATVTVVDPPPPSLATLVKAINTLKAERGPALELRITSAGTLQAAEIHE